MNIVKFYRVQRSTGTVECRRVKVCQPSYAQICKSENGFWHRGLRRLRTVVQAEDEMLQYGWSRKKPKVPAHWTPLPEAPK